MARNETYPVLQEYPLQSSFAELIPARAQRGLSTFDLEFTCLDADGSYLVIGSNVGIAYLVNREKDFLQKLRDNDQKNAISCIKVLISLECLVAVGYRDGAVLVYKVPFKENQEIEKFTVQGLHSSSVTALEWTKNGIQFFSGDENGIIVCTEIDHLEHQSRSRILIEEKSKVIQLNYSHFNLVVSTLFRSVIYSLKTNTAIQIGQKERKCFGPFGAIISDDQSGTIFASRPGQRLWKSDMSGIIQETMLFKQALSETRPKMQTLTKINENISYVDFQFERLAMYMSYILIWTDSCIILIDPKQKIVVATSPKLDPIVDVATCKNEIFILRGLRHIVRISPEPDIYSTVKAVNEESSVLEELLEPFKGLTTYVKERSDSTSVQTESNSTLFGWLKKKRSVSSPPNISADDINSNQMETSEPLPDIVNLNSNECIPVKIEQIPAVLKDTPLLITQDFTKGNDSDDVVYKVKKKHKKNKKVQFAIDAAPKREKHKSKPSTNSTKSSNNNAEKNINSNIVNQDTDQQPVTLHVPYSVETNSTSSETASAKVDNKFIIPISGQIFNKKNDVDADKLLEDVLNAYCSLKHQDSPTEDPQNSLNSGDTDLKNSCDVKQNDDTDSGANISPTENSQNECDNIQQTDLTQDVNDNTITADANDQDSRDADADEVYSLSYTESEIKVPKSESSMDSLSLENSSLSSLDFRSTDPPKYGVDWVEYKAPELLLHISVSSDHIFCVDVRNQMYFSRHPEMGSLYWIELDQPAEKIASSDSETVVWVLYRETVYAASHKALCLWENTEWLSIARDVVSIAVDDECGWYVKSNGELITQQNLTLTMPSNYPENVPCNSPALQVAIKDDVLWVLTISGSLLARKAVDRNKSKSLWKEVILDEVPGIDSIFLGSKKTGWIIDSNGMIRFIIGVTPENPEGTGQPWLVEASNYLFRPSTQLEQVVRRALNSETLTNLIRGKQHLCLSASEMGVWFCKTYDNLLYSNQKSIIGHMWELIVPPNTAIAIKWNLIAADGINNAEGALWCVNGSGELFCYDIKSQTMFPVEFPFKSSIRCIQPKYQSLWILSDDGSIYVRRGITPSCLQGLRWQELDLAQFGAQQIIHISCSSFVSWACTTAGEVYMRLGTLSPSSSKLSQAWLSIGTANEQAYSPLEKLSAIGKHFPLPLISTHCSQDGFCKVYVGPQGYPVWAVDRKRNVYVREGVSTNLPIGKKWTLIPDLHAKELCISSNAVWLLKSSGKIYRRFGVTEKNPCGDYWKQMPGNLDWLSVTEDDDLWGIQNGSMFCHYSFVLYGTLSSVRKTSLDGEISEEGWEDIMEDFEDT